jgi:hypothetical protein
MGPFNGRTSARPRAAVATEVTTRLVPRGLVALALLWAACSGSAGTGGNQPGGAGAGEAGFGGGGDGSDSDAQAGAPGSGGELGGNGSDGGSSGGGGGPDVGDAGPAPACNDDQGTPAACVAPPGDGGCASVAAYCERASSLLKPAAAARVVACINGLTQCDEGQAARCVKVALFSSCPDVSAESACADVSQACANGIPTTIEECHAFLNGMMPAGRDAVLSCLTPSDGGAACQGGVFACIRAW